jgi:uncharacterized protein YecE (DUF72 family)
MSEAMLIGARGWEHADWAPDFYPEELPADWRFCYYSNRLRAVLVPGEAWAGVDAAVVESWRAESDPGFRFVLELPSTIVFAADSDARSAAVADFAARIAPIRGQVEGALLRLPAATPLDLDWLARVVRQLDAVFPLCVDLPPGAWRAAAQRVVEAGAGLCWRVADPEPAPGGRLRLALAPAASPGILRGWIERLARSADARTVAGLFFEGPGAAPAAEAARVIAELLAV